MSTFEKYGSHIFTFLADSRWMLVATLRLINRWKPCSSPNASSNQDSVANFLRGWKIVISNLSARGPLVLPSISRPFFHVKEFLFLHQFLPTPTIFTRQLTHKPTDMTSQYFFVCLSWKLHFLGKMRVIFLLLLFSCPGQHNDYNDYRDSDLDGWLTVREWPGPIQLL